MVPALNANWKGGGSGSFHGEEPRLEKIESRTDEVVKKTGSKESGHKIE